jgi:hypothetical protein
VSKVRDTRDGTVETLEHLVHSSTHLPKVGFGMHDGWACVAVLPGRRRARPPVGWRRPR